MIVELKVKVDIQEEENSHLLEVTLQQEARDAVKNALENAYQNGFDHGLADYTSIEVVSVNL